jgi:hypothetical protein
MVISTLYKVKVSNYFGPEGHVKNHQFVVTETNVSLLFIGELGNDYYDAFSSVKEKRLGIFYDVCFYSQPMANAFQLGHCSMHVL